MPHSEYDELVFDARVALPEAQERFRRAEAERDRLQAAVDRAYGALSASQYVGGPSEREAWQIASAALGEFVTVHQGTTKAAPEGTAPVAPGEADG